MSAERQLTASIRAHAIAQKVEWLHAKDRARLKRTSAEVEYDPLAATCLGDLIYRAMGGHE